ncbi:MAG: transcription antitermination factor NusB [Candidatus Marinimicrobia bacterium]|jgi:N utilization substance protein B|nr:transcription antitermination factor NusB [Candidatus Neomarinimicrobiota bacterium]MBT3495632.1 transcription antitermination factor NusB [Candidatus Neomarinimicrobiota bacterium]MBT3692000.1 transcription antitermination factor NusB [Candidatus Neomarinimicrobiota bacterium]MBT3731912.1 transcription antitermination factor NusB [Candidatus Neomarinimicrobiota bacterium]MBT4143896.1 transcription antitermination factor NusB [Candidatus Neomarinimicrobiota bacterium]
MHPNRLARECVLKALYAYDISQEAPEKILKSTLASFSNHKDLDMEFMKTLYTYVYENQNWANQHIKDCLQNWEFSRVATVDQILLRMGICEIYFMEDVPPKVSISEAVEIAKVYSTGDSSGFVNGILDSIYKKYLKEEAKTTKDNN